MPLTSKPRITAAMRLFLLIIMDSFRYRANWRFGRTFRLATLNIAAHDDF
jgi:hypothetical protein